MLNYELLTLSVRVQLWMHRNVVLTMHLKQLNDGVVVVGYPILADMELLVHSKESCSCDVCGMQYQNHLADKLVRNVVADGILRHSF